MVPPTTIWNAKGSDIKYVKGFRPVAELGHLQTLAHVNGDMIADEKT